VLVSGWFQWRPEKKPADSVAQFQNQLSVLERRLEVVRNEPTMRQSYAVAEVHASRPAGAVPVTLRDAQLRRRNVLGALFLVTCASLVPTALWGGPFVTASLAAAGTLGGYLLVLRRIQVRKLERAKVRYLPNRRSGDLRQPALLHHLGT
jgi:hypothetical protein